LKKGGGYKLAKFAESAFKDISKGILKAAAETIERNAWIEYFEKDIAARSYYPVYASTADLYWQVYDYYNELLKKKAAIEEGYNPNCGFKTYLSEAFDDNQTITVSLGIQRPSAGNSNLKLMVLLGDVELSPGGNDSYRVAASQLKPAADGGLVLKVH